MSFIDTKSLPINSEFEELIIDFTLSALKNKPDNLYEYASNYFENLLENRMIEMPVSPMFEKHISQWASRMASSSDIFEDAENYRKKSRRRLAISSESWNPHDLNMQTEISEIISPKSEDEKELLRRLISRITIFKSLDDDEIDGVILGMTKLEVKEREVIIQQGDPGDHFYVIQSGVFDVYVKDEYDGLEFVSTYNNQGSFGELALLYNAPRSATIIAKTNGVLWYMNRQTFKSIVIMKAHAKRLKCVNFISSVSLFESLNKNEQLNIADSIHMKTYEKNFSIIKQGEEGEHMYFIESGRVAVIIESNGIRKQLAVLEKGQYFGELSLMTDKPRAATIVTLEETVVGMLERSCFERMLGPCIEILRRNAMNYEKVLRASFSEQYFPNL